MDQLVGTQWYRFEIRNIEEPFLGAPDVKVAIECEAYPVTKETDRGVWLNYFGERKFVLKTATKRFAYPTRGEALKGFYFRKRRHAQILHWQLKVASAAEREAERLMQAQGVLQ